MYGILIFLFIVFVDIIRIRFWKSGLPFFCAIFYATFLYTIAWAADLTSYQNLVVEWLLTFLFLVNFYIIKTGIDEVSPTLLIYRTVDERGIIPMNELRKLFLNERSIQSRLDILIRDDFVALSDDKYHLTKKGALAVKIWNILGRLF